MTTKQDKLLDKATTEFVTKHNIDKIAPLLDARVEFSYIPLEYIEIKEQVRSSSIDDNEDFIALVESIKQKGVLQPVLVVETAPNRYRLIAGERRYRASIAAGKFNVPARILDGQFDDKDIKIAQLTENLQRIDLNPYDEAKGYFDVYKLLCEKDNIDVDGMIKDITKIKLKPETAENLTVVILSIIQKLSGKSISYIERLVSILKLPSEAINALKNNQISMAQALVFVGNIGHPKFYDILDRAIKNKMTAKSVAKVFAGKTRGGGIAFYKKRAVHFRNDIEKNKDSISKHYASELLAVIDNIKNVLLDIVAEDSNTSSLL